MGGTTAAAVLSDSNPAPRGTLQVFFDYKEPLPVQPAAEDRVDRRPRCLGFSNATPDLLEQLRGMNSPKPKPTSAAAEDKSEMESVNPAVLGGPQELRDCS